MEISFEDDSAGARPTGRDLQQQQEWWTQTHLPDDQTQEQDWWNQTHVSSRQVGEEERSEQGPAPVDTPEIRGQTVQPSPPTPMQLMNTPCYSGAQSTTTLTTTTLLTTMGPTMSTTNPRTMMVSGSTCLASLRTPRSKTVRWRISRMAERGRARFSGEARRAGAQVSPVMICNFQPKRLARAVVLKTTSRFH